MNTRTFKRRIRKVLAEERKGKIKWFFRKEDPGYMWPLYELHGWKGDKHFYIRSHDLDNLTVDKFELAVIHMVKSMEEKFANVK